MTSARHIASYTAGSSRGTVPKSKTSPNRFSISTKTWLMAPNIPSPRRSNLTSPM